MRKLFKKFDKCFHEQTLPVGDVYVNTRWMVTILISLISIVVAIILAIWKLEPAIEPIPPETNHLTRSINQTAESVQEPKTSDQDKTE